MARLIVFVMVLLLSSFVLDGQAYRLSSLFQEGQIVYSCVGKRANFPFEFTPEKDEKLLFIRWTFDGYFSSQSIATFTPSPDDFNPSPQYTDRITQVGNAGIALDHVTLADDGNYTVEISGLGSSGNYFTLQGLATLQIGDKLMTERQEVRLTQMPEAVKVKDTGRWSVALACGKFTHLGVPPFPVYWTTPSGEVIKESSSYTDGHYTLLLPNPVRGGNYSCEVPQLFADEACLGVESQSKAEATVTVDEISARLTLLEAHQTELLQDNVKLNSQLARDAMTIQELSSRLNQSTEALTARVTGLENVTVNSSETIQDQETMLADLDLKLKDLATPRIAFNAKSTINQELSPPSHVQFNSVLYNQGNGYNVSTGHFTAPVSGTYFFIFQTRSTSNKHAYSYIMADNQEVCRAFIYKPYEQGSCHAAVHLKAGDSVWVVPYTSNMYYTHTTTAFTGYLINDDPL